MEFLYRLDGVQRKSINQYNCTQHTSCFCNWLSRTDLTTDILNILSVLHYFLPPPCSTLVLPGILTKINCGFKCRTVWDGHGSWRKNESAVDGDGSWQWRETIPKIKTQNGMNFASCRFL